MGFDNTIAIGDIVTAYHKGYWYVVKIETREKLKCNPMVYLKLALSSDGKKIKRTSECDISYCTKMSKQYLSAKKEQELNEVNEKYTALLALFEV